MNLDFTPDLTTHFLPTSGEQVNFLYPNEIQTAEHVILFGVWRQLG